MRVTLFVTVAAASKLAESPVSKVLGMLKDLQSKVTREGEDNQRAFEKYSDWCRGSAQKLQFDIKDTKEQIEDLESVVAKAKSDIQDAETRIGELGEDTAEAEADLNKAAKQREREHTDFKAEEQELMDAISSLERARGILAKELAKTGFLQYSSDAFGEVVSMLATVVSSASIASADRNQLMALVQGNTGDETVLLQQAPEASAYDSHDGSHVILDTLQDMQEKAENQLAKARDANLKSKHDFEMVKQSIDQNMMAQIRELKERKSAKALAEETLAGSQADLQFAQKDLKMEGRSLKEVQHDCMTKAAEFEGEMKENREELAVLAKAMEIIAESTDKADKAEYSEAQVGEVDSESFLQIKAHSRLGISPDQAGEIVERLRKVGLTQLASRIRAVSVSRGDIFGKVKSMVGEMIAKLEKEASEEADTKAFCDKEMNESEAKKGDHEGRVETLTTRLDKAKSSIAKLKERLGQVIAEQGEIGVAQQQLDAIRTQEKEAFDVSLKDYSDGLKGVQTALKVLRDYYSAKEDDSSFMQASDSSFGFMQQKTSATATEAKSGGAAGGIIAMLEVVESDFSKSITQLTDDEAEKQEEYDAETQKNRERRAALIADQKGKEAEIKNLKATVSELNDDRDGEQSELDAVQQYIKELEPKCISKPEPYAEKKKRRDAEIAGLKDALEILEGNAIA